jgi:hypothetical protein
MADQASSLPLGDETSAASVAVPADKGKSKSAAPEEPDVNMMDEDEPSDDSEPEDAVSISAHS